MELKEIEDRLQYLENHGEEPGYEYNYWPDDTVEEIFELAKELLKKLKETSSNR